MPKILCECDETIFLQEIPCKNQWLMISDVDMNRFEGQVNRSDIYDAMAPVVRCPKCHRLWIFWEGFGKPPAQYILAKSTT